jgi:hypothetical protein
MEAISGNSRYQNGRKGIKAAVANRSGITGGVNQSIERNRAGYLQQPSGVYFSGKSFACGGSAEHKR